MAQKVLQRPPPGLHEAMEKVSATEELDIEHAMLERIMLVMGHTLKKAESGGGADLSPISKACEMISSVVDKHHMKIEEEEIYPKFKEDPLLGPLARDLKIQHVEARKMVARMDSLCKTGSVRDKSEMEELNRVFTDFRDMMTAHAAREATVLFPAMMGTWSDDELDNLKETQEKDEKKLLGKDADEKIYSMLGELESSAGIESVKDFTRRLK
jgi:hemerythrin-like domain-containing protein